MKYGKVLRGVYEASRTLQHEQMNNTVNWCMVIYKNNYYVITEGINFAVALISHVATKQRYNTTYIYLIYT